MALLALLGIGQLSFASADKKIIQVSGVIMTSDSLHPVPYAHVKVKGSPYGTVSSLKGYFSFAALTGDTIEFRSIGFKDAFFILPDSLDSKKYSVIQLMTEDTLHISETLIYPWPSKEQFKSAFLALDLPDDDLERAKNNLEREKLREIASTMDADGNEAADWVMRQTAQSYYHYGQAPPMNIFNVFAWAKFIEAWKNGDFKRKK